MRIKWVHQNSGAVLQLTNVGIIDIKPDVGHMYKVKVFTKELWGRYNDLTTAKQAGLKIAKEMMADAIVAIQQ